MHSATDDEIRKWLKSIKNAGTSGNALGWFLIFFAPLLFLLLASSGEYDTATLFIIWLVIIPMSGYFIFSGKYITALRGESIGYYLLINGFLSLVLLQGLIPLIVSLQSFFAYSRYKKLARIDVTINPDYKHAKIGYKEVTIFSIAVIFGTVILVSAL